MKPTDNKVIFNGLTYKLVLDEPEPAPEWQPREGELCEFWDFDRETCRPVIGYFVRRSTLSGEYYTRRDTSWRKCRPLQDPNIIQMIPWEGGECPVPEDAKVLILDRSGDMTSVTAGHMRWNHIGSGGDIVKYAVLK
jgi:hypothetical protein